MNAKHRSDQQNIDHWLNSALRARIDSEPRMGLEERVLASLAAKTQRRFGWWPVLAMAGVTVAAIAIIVALLRPTDQVRTIANRTAPLTDASVRNSASAGTSATPKIADIHKPRNSQTIRHADGGCCSTRTAALRKSEDSLPKLSSFPAAHEETEQERLLAQLATRLTVQKQFSEIARISIDSPPEELSITELQIEPLEPAPAISSPQE